MAAAARTADDEGMAEPARVQTYDDYLHGRRRKFAVVREPIDFEAARLRKLQEKARDTLDP
jgi:predicted HicB family RNase H-like nuclease